MGCAVQADAAPPPTSAARAWPAGPPGAWRAPLAQLAFVCGLFAVLTVAEWAEMARQWWDSATYNHILMVPPILVWLVRLRAPQLARLTPQAWWPGIAALPPALVLWTVGSTLEINTASQLGAVMMFQVAVLTLLGPKVTAALLFPLAYMLFLVPFGDELIPGLQALTARMAVSLTHASGVPAVIDGVLIDTPAGLFVVAEACSGVKFLIAMVALGTLVAHLCFRSPWRRALFMAAAIVVPILANGVRAWGTIFIAQSQGIEFAAGFDHIVYGWVFFAVVMGGLLLGAWRYFDRAPDEPLIDTVAIDRSALLTQLERWRMPGWAAAGAMALLALVAVIAAPSFAGTALERYLAAGLPGHAPMDRAAQVP
jgi:exosortase A